ncbi:hypothetical protein ACFWXK_20500 [Streptomyces sp. NPDC059070]|uniref:hypothetical protein n=1 Tax=Streptomyces sp. NPDC059070 TaxID=3346713 RepID=UPI00369FC19C
MSHELWIHKFVDGEAVAPGMGVIKAVLQPHSVKSTPPVVRDDESIAIWIRASDGGEAELVASESGIVVDRPAGGEILGIIAELVSQLGAVIIDPRDGAFICGAEERVHLPAEYQQDAVIIEMTGPALQDVTTGPPRQR